MNTMSSQRKIDTVAQVNKSVENSNQYANACKQAVFGIQCQAEMKTCIGS